MACSHPLLSSTDAGVGDDDQAMAIDPSWKLGKLYLSHPLRFRWINFQYFTEDNCLSFLVSLLIDATDHLYSERSHFEAFIHKH
jgi:hypothetical protein